MPFKSKIILPLTSMGKKSCMMEEALENSYFVYLVLLNFYQSAVAEQSIHKVIGNKIIVRNI